MADKPPALFVPLDKEWLDRRSLYAEQIASRVAFLREHIQYVYEKAAINRWLVRRRHGLPELIEDEGRMSLSQSVSQSASKVTAYSQRPATDGVLTI